ncbi:DUF664 domain-containing protein [Pseudarthrobacter sp. DSP2-3-2b1]|uniref:mycothiol transferase n=1 Tax=Pseudarthrobacter sp. DSP2-3-2b1 TaxID=2804661 RepID=UPI003CEA563A
MVAVERRQVTLHQILVRMVVERAHHLGHADILRELIDGATGQRPGDLNLTQHTPEEWAAHRSAIEDVAHTAFDATQKTQYRDNP